MVLFTGAVIGYLTNFISKFIDRSDDGSRKLVISGHTVILEWNSRASEIVNEMLYLEGRQNIVILSSAKKDTIEKEINERLSNTVDEENAAVRRASEGFPFFKRVIYRAKNKFKNRLTVIVREGDTFSTKQLNDISLKRAKTIIILGSDVSGSDYCKYDQDQYKNERERGNPQSIKSLVQVAEITGGADSDDNQKIVIEVEDNWTLGIVKKIIEQKAVEGKCNITPVSVNKILGQLLSQFSLMPELNLAYRELFSNKGMTFFSAPSEFSDEDEYFKKILENNDTVLPLSLMTSEENGKTRHVAYFASENETDLGLTSQLVPSSYDVKINRDYWIEQKNVIIIGHNSKIGDIMAGFSSFLDEWNNEAGDIVRIVMIDDKAHLEKMNYYRDNPSVIKTVEADVYDREIICSEIEAFVDSNETDTSILILSDDTVTRDRIDSATITNLIYVRDIIQRRKKEIPGFREDSIDVIVEILNPKHYDIVKSYSINNIVISNRYISKMITQIGEKEDMFNFFEDILSYDEAGEESFNSKEIYIKKVSRYFEEIPAKCTASELVRAIYAETSGPDLDIKKRDEAIMLGYVDANGGMHLFTGERSDISVELDKECKVIFFSNH